MTRIWGIHNDKIPASELVADGFVSIGWDDLGDLTEIGDDQSAIRERLRTRYPEAKEGALSVWAGILRRFAFEMAIGDVVIAADRQARLINIGVITGPYRFDGSGVLHAHRHAVDWLVTGLPRTTFSQPALNEIGSAMTLFEVRRHAGEFLRALADAGHPLEVAPSVEETSDWGEDLLRDLGDEYLRTMRTGDSVFTPGKQVWTHQVAEELERVYVERLDAGSGTFDEKLDAQLAGVSDEGLQLFAELWCLNLAPLTDYSPATKRKLLTQMLSRMVRPVHLPAKVDAALDGAAFKGGMAFKTRRPYQLMLLIRFASALLAKSEVERETVLSDPKAFAALLQLVPEPNEPAVRCELRWLLFPDYYLPIVSGKHRTAIRDAFVDLLDGTAADLDEELFQIRAGLADEFNDRHVDFYAPPVVDRWDPDRVLSGAPATTAQVASRSAYKTPRYAVASSVVNAIETGEWSTYTDVAEVAGLIPGQVGEYLGHVHHDGGYRVIQIDGSTYAEEQREALEADGITFSPQGRADAAQRVTKETLRARLDAAGLLPKAVRRAWLVRGNNVNGQDLVPSWLAKGRVSLAATSLSEVEPGITRDQLKPIVDEDYAHASYAARAEKLDEFHAFLSRMQAGSLIVTIDQGLLHLGEITGDARSETAGNGEQILVRNVDWHGNVALDALPGELTARLKVQRAVLDLTQQLDVLESLLDADPALDDVHVDEPVVLPGATDELADDLNVDRGWLQECIELLRDRPQLIFYGPPGTGKTYIAQALAAHLAGDNVRLVQFHPAYTYEDFFEGFRPTEKGTFELKPGPMRRVVDQAVANPRQPHVLIIDEINRGNLAKVFGELYFLLEYRDSNVELLYGDGDFSLPANVFMIGTMNTADRSIALVDAAMRRRFAFLPLHPSDDPTKGLLRRWLAAKGKPARGADLLDELNSRIEDEDFKIGPSYFMRDAVFEAGGLERTWRTSILPLLEEHHFGEMTAAEVAARYGYDAIAARFDSAVAAKEVGDAQPPTE